MDLSYNLIFIKNKAIFYKKYNNSSLETSLLKKYDYVDIKIPKARLVLIAFLLLVIKNYGKW